MKRLFLLAFVVVFGYRSSADCVQVSKAECDGLKTDLEAYCNQLAGYLDTCYQAVDDVNLAQQNVTEAAVSAEDLLGLLPDEYTYYVWQFQEILGRVNSDLDVAKEGLYDGLMNIDDNLWSAYEMVIGLNCEVCSQGGPGSDDPGGGGGDSSECPCAAYIQSLKITLEHIDGDLHEINQRLQYWEKYIEMLEKIRDKTESIDDFMQDELKEAMKNFFKSFFDVSDYKDPPKVQWYKLYTEEMARSWFFDDYTNASAFVQKDAGRYDFLEKGKLIFNSPQHPNNFDFGEYQNFNWFQRVEFMLGNLVGVFSTTNAVAADLTDSQKQQAEDQEQVVKDAFGEGAFSDSKSLVGQLFESVETLQSKLNPFHGLFSSSHSAQPIEILPETAVSSVLVQNTSPGIYLDTKDYGSSGFGIHDIVDVAHNLTTFIYLVFFLVVDIAAFVFFVRGLMAIVQWYHKIVLSWFKTFNVR